MSPGPSARAPRRGLRSLPATVFLLGLVSFLTDASSEMILPLLPLFLKSLLGAGAEALGWIEGVAESTSALVRLVSGWWADRSGRNKPLILLGYGLSGLMRPLIGLASIWPAVLILRFADRVGKGIRSAPRDALLAKVTPPKRRGEAFGIHRSMDHAGAVVGPLIAAFLLQTLGLSFRVLFLWAFVPGLVVMAVLLSLKEKSSEPGRRGGRPRVVPPPPKMVLPSGAYRPFLAALFVFTLGNSTDTFILLRLSDLGLPAAWILGLWSLHHVVKMVSTYLGGYLSDGWGRKVLIVGGWIFYAAVYAGFALAHSLSASVALFLAYGLYYGLTEPVEKALVADLAPKSARGSAFGFYHMAVGLGALPASVLFGFLWKFVGPACAFLTGSGLALAASVLLLLTLPRSRRV